MKIVWQDYIEFNPDIRFGKPSLKGTRITVGDVLGWLADGASQEEIMEDFLEVTREHIQAVLAYAHYRESVTKSAA